MLNVIQAASDSTVVIVGTGVVGLAALMSLKMSKTPPQRIIAADIVRQRLETANSLGATHLIDSRATPDLRKALMDITNGEGVDGAIDTTGRPEIVEALLGSTGKKGKVVTVGVGDVCHRNISLLHLTPADHIQLSAQVSHNIYKLVVNGGSYVGCNQGNCYPQDFIPRMIEAWQGGLFPFDDLIKTYPAKELEKAAHDIHNGTTIKAVLVWG